MKRSSRRDVSKKKNAFTNRVSSLPEGKTLAPNRGTHDTVAPMALLAPKEPWDPFFSFGPRSFRPAEGDAMHARAPRDAR